MAKMRVDEEQLQRIMTTLELSRDEALQVLVDDREVDRMSMPVVEGDLTDQQRKVVKEMRGIGTRKTATTEKQETKTKGPTVYKFEQKERKQDVTKEGVIAELYKFLSENATFGAENVQITNPSKEIAFNLGNESFSLTIVRHRTPKGK